MRPAVATRFAPCTGPRRRAALRLLSLLAAVTLGVVISSCSIGLPSSAGVSSGQAIMDLESAVLQLREDHALLQAEIDSLRGVASYQDTIIRQLAALSNVSMRPPSSSLP